MRIKRFFISCILVNCIINTVMGQDFQGKAYYKTKTNVDLNLDNREISEAMKQRIMERVKSRMEQSFELVFDRTTSVYTQEEKLDTPGGQSGFRMAFAGAGVGVGEYYKDVQSQEYASQTEMFGKIFLIKDSLNTWEWKLGSETKQIGNYTCYKATAVRQVNENMVNRMRNALDRNNNEEAKDSTAQGSSNSVLARIEPENTEIIAWYAPEIPVSQGPGPYWGLPGLIMEVNDGRTAILCSKLVLNSADKVKIQAPSKGKVVTQDEYDDILAKKMEEMSERFRSNGRSGGNRIIIRG